VGRAQLGRNRGVIFLSCEGTVENRVAVAGGGEEAQKIDSRGGVPRKEKAETVRSQHQGEGDWPAFGHAMARKLELEGEDYLGKPSTRGSCKKNI